MRRKIWLLALVGMVLWHTPAAWGDDFYVIAGGRGVGTRITSVPYTITTPGFYYLGGNLTYSGISTAIMVTADDVTLDLMGFSLTYGGPPGYASTYGIWTYNHTNVEIRNGTVRGFSLGIFSSGNNNRVINIRATGNSDGIVLGGSNHRIKSCNCSNNSRGILLDSGLITDCVVSNNHYGIWMDGPGNVLGNAVFNNSSSNFSLGNGVATAIMVDRNSAFGLATNYYVYPGTTGVQWGINAGSP